MDINVTILFKIISTESLDSKRFKVYLDYKLNLKAYSKRRFDPFCRWQRITIPCDKDQYIQTTIGQLNFFKWALENKVIEYIENNYSEIENDMNSRNSTSKRKSVCQKTRKKREELSISATKSIKREQVEITVEFK
jgi:iron uptake system EfeUOB component EfeO/EfeM